MSAITGLSDGIHPFYSVLLIFNRFWTEKDHSISVLFTLRLNISIGVPLEEKMLLSETALGLFE